MGRRIGCGHPEAGPSAFIGRTIPGQLLGFLILALLLPAGASAQIVRYGAVTSQARAMLQRLWTDEPTQPERAYCVMGWSAVSMRDRTGMRPAQDTVYTVSEVRRAPVNAAGPNSVDFECQPGTPELHTHTPSTCTGDEATSCVAGGINAFSCQPSRQDLEKLVRRGDSFAVVQCDARAFRFYYPYEYQGGPTIVASGAEVGARKPGSPPPQGGSRAAVTPPRRSH